MRQASPAPAKYTLGGRSEVGKAALLLSPRSRLIARAVGNRRLLVNDVCPQRAHPAPRERIETPAR